MKNFYKNPIFYYVVVPLLIGAWPLMLWSKYLPDTKGDLEKWTEHYGDAQGVIEEILMLDPDRLDHDTRADGTVKFDYLTAIHKAAKICDIPATRVELNAGTVSKSSKGQKSQTANVKLKDVGILYCARFLSSVLIQWPNLQCTQISLDGNKQAKDLWDISLQMKYFY